MTITTGKLARTAGVGIQTIRFYEREGLLEPAPRSESGYRKYGDADLARLRFIRRAQELGFTLREIRELIELQGSPDAPCDRVCEKATEKLADVRQRIADLTRMENALAALTGTCEGSVPVSQCTVVESLRVP